MVSVIMRVDCSRFHSLAKQRGCNANTSETMQEKLSTLQGNNRLHRNLYRRSRKLEARQLTWSNYKHNNSLKVFIGISPTGAIIFVSTAYGGRVSDKVITQRSGFLDLLEYGDHVLADRGFLVEDDIAAHSASLVLPSFTKGKSQLSQR